MTGSTVPDTAVIIVARMRALPGKEPALLDAFAALVAATRAEEGCLTYDLHRGLDDRDEFVMYEVWASPAMLAAHNDSVHLRAFGETSKELLDGGVTIHRLARLEPSAAEGEIL